MSTHLIDSRPAAPPSTRGLGLAPLRELQALAYACAEAVAADLTVGTRERDAVAAMEGWLAARGVKRFFHKPFAWFGARTALRWRTPLGFPPTDTALARGMPYILDLAPMNDGWVADIGYAGVLGDNAVWSRIMRDLAAHRALILERVRARAPLADIYREVGALAAQQGHEVRHAAYPGEVLAHRIDRLPPLSGVGAALARTLPSFVLGLGRDAVTTLARIRLGGEVPLWNGDRAARRAPTPGVWAVEPHLADGDVGAKFEEVLVVTHDDAYWLDDDLPHVRRWREEGVAV